MFSWSVVHGNVTVDVSEGGGDCLAYFLVLCVFYAEFFRPIVEVESGGLSRIGVGGMVYCQAHIVGRAALQVDVMTVEVEAVVV